MPGPTYTLTVTVPGGSPGSAPAAVKTATSTLASTVGLPVAAPVVIRTLGGGAASFTVAPRRAGTTNQVRFVADVNGSGTATFYSFDATAGGTFNLSATSGPKNAQGAGSPPFADGDEIAAYVVAADYNILALGPPGQPPAKPGSPDQRRHHGVRAQHHGLRHHRAPGHDPLKGPHGALKSTPHVTPTV